MIKYKTTITKRSKSNIWKIFIFSIWIRWWIFALGRNEAQWV